MVIPGTVDKGDTSSQGKKPFFSAPLTMGAHRGGRALWPESTLEGFKAAAARWPGILLESDAHVTSDGHVVLMHDDTVDRTTNGMGAVSDITFAELRALDAGYRFTQDDGLTYPFRGKGIVAPTLGEVLTALPESRFLIELKNQVGVADAVVTAVREAKAVDRVALASFNPALMERARVLAPDIAGCFDFVNGMNMLGALRGNGWADYRPEADMLALEMDLVASLKLTVDELRAVRERGIAVMVHTVNNPAQMREFLDMGVDSILTDKPDVLAAIIAERANRH